MKTNERKHTLAVLLEYINNNNMIFFDYIGRNKEYRHSAFDKVYSFDRRVPIQLFNYEVNFNNTYAVTINHYHFNLKIEWPYFFIMKVKEYYTLGAINDRTTANLKWSIKLESSKLERLLNWLLIQQISMFDTNLKPLVGYSFYEFKNVGLFSGSGRLCLTKFYFDISSIVLHVEIKNEKDRNKYIRVEHGSIYSDIENVYMDKFISPFLNKSMICYSDFLREYGAVSQAAQYWVIFDILALE
jgi:hypothetical protein